MHGEISGLKDFSNKNKNGNFEIGWSYIVDAIGPWKALEESTDWRGGGGEEERKIDLNGFTVWKMTKENGIVNVKRTAKEKKGLTIL